MKSWCTVNLKHSMSRCDMIILLQFVFVCVWMFCAWVCLCVGARARVCMCLCVCMCVVCLRVCLRVCAMSHIPSRLCLKRFDWMAQQMSRIYCISAWLRNLFIVRNTRLWFEANFNSCEPHQFRHAPKKWPPPNLFPLAISLQLFLYFESIPPSISFSLSSETRKGCRSFSCIDLPVWLIFIVCGGALLSSSCERPQRVSGKYRWHRWPKFED